MDIQDFGNKLMKDMLKDDLKEAMMAGNLTQRDAIRIILGEISRLQNKDPDNLMVIDIIKRLIRDQRKGFNDKAFIAVCEDYIPEELKELGEDVIIDWIKKNVNFSQYKNKMEAMRPIMLHFKGKVDGDMVKAIIKEM